VGDGEILETYSNSAPKNTSGTDIFPHWPKSLLNSVIAVCSRIHTKHINTLCGQNVELHLNIQPVPRSKHSVSVTKTSQLMLYREIIAVCSKIHSKHTNTLCGQNVELLNVELVVHIRGEFKK